jgi:hypothetical protein
VNIERFDPETAAPPAYLEDEIRLVFVNLGNLHSKRQCQTRTKRDLPIRARTNIVKMGNLSR